MLTLKGALKKLSLAKKKSTVYWPSSNLNEHTRELTVHTANHCVISYFTVNLNILLAIYIYG